MLVAQADVALPDAGLYLQPICDHLGEHGAEIEKGETVVHVRFEGSRGTLQAVPGRLLLKAEAQLLSDLISLRASLASHLVEFAGKAAGRIVWTGDGSDVTSPGEFRLMKVAGVQTIAPAMRRLTLSGEDLARFSTAQNLHCKLLFAPAGRGPVWPKVGPDGLIHWPTGEDKLLVRKYTIRHVDAERGTIAIDFVLHADAGPGSAFGENAVVGDVVGVIGPGGLGIRPADWYLLAGDETALPAIARILESLPSSARGIALIEVPDRHYVQDLDAPSGIAIRWLSRDGVPAGSTTDLADAVATVQIPASPTRVFAWAGTEFTAFRSIRAHLRQAVGLRADQHHVVAYWRRSETKF
nr:siderophore-interacting protein [Aurantimonas endophytica]